MRPPHVLTRTPTRMLTQLGQMSVMTFSASRPRVLIVVTLPHHEAMSSVYGSFKSGGGTSGRMAGEW